MRASARLMPLIVHAISSGRRAFYGAVSFLSSPLEPMMPMVGVHDLSKALNP